MATDQSTATDHAGTPALDERAIRSKAAHRSAFCPGAGFAIVGNCSLAITTFVAYLAILPAIAWLSFQPQPPLLWIALGMVAIALTLSLVEQIAVRKARLRTSRPRILVGGFAAATCTQALAVILALGFVFTGFGSLRTMGGGMLPTLENGERLVYHKHLDRQRVKPGAIIVFENADSSAWGKPGWIITSRVLAGPGDQLSIQHGNYMINGNKGPQVGNTGLYPIVTEVPSAPQTLTVPDHCYFTAQDFPSGGLDSRVLSWVHAFGI